MGFPLAFCNEILDKNNNDWRKALLELKEKYSHQRYLRNIKYNMNNVVVDIEDPTATNNANNNNEAKDNKNEQTLMSNTQIFETTQEYRQQHIRNSMHASSKHQRNQQKHAALKCYYSEYSYLSVMELHNLRHGVEKSLIVLYARECCLQLLQSMDNPQDCHEFLSTMDHNLQKMLQNEINNKKIQRTSITIQDVENDENSKDKNIDGKNTNSNTDTNNNTNEISNKILGEQQENNKNKK